MAEVKNICLEALERHCASGTAGRLDFHRGQHDGQIFVDNKLIVHAQIGPVEGVPALFRLFDWGDAETTWQAGVTPEHTTLHLTMEAASMLWAESLQDRAEMEEKEREKLDDAFASGLINAESVLKAYTVSLESVDPNALAGGFTFADATKSSYVIGSSDDCDVKLVGTNVDPLHCGVILEGGRVLVWDLGAHSGVKINGKTVSESSLKVGDVMTLGSCELRVRFQLRRPTLKIKAPAPGEKPADKPAAAQIPSTGTMPMPKIDGPPKEIPKGPITYAKVAKQLKNRDAGKPFLEKLSSLFGGKKK
jgi:hypothetical protein